MAARPRVRRAAFPKARRVANGQATARLRQASTAAVSAVLKIMVDGSAPASVYAAPCGRHRVCAHGKAIEIEDVDATSGTLAEQAAKFRFELLSGKLIRDVVVPVDFDVVDAGGFG
jgi:hypothetical protein